MNLSKRLHHTSLNFLARFLATLLVISVISPASTYAQKKQKFEVGDIVDVTKFDETSRGIVTEVSHSNWPNVKYISTKDFTISEDKLELLEGDNFGPGAKVRFERFGETKDGFIVDSEENLREQQRKEHLDKLPPEMRARVEKQHAAMISRRNRSPSKKQDSPTDWNIEILVEKDGAFTDSNTRLVRRISKRLNAFASREWTNSTGKFKVQAKFVTRDGDTIELKQDNGKEITLPFKKLSRKDQKFLSAVAKQQAESPNVSSSSSPPTLEELFFELREIESLPPKLLLPEFETPKDVAWNVTTDPAGQSGPYQELELPLVIIGRKASQNSFSDIHSSVAGGASAIGVVNILEKTSAAFIWKPGDSKATKFPIVNEDSQLFAISPDGKIVVGKQGSTSGMSNSESTLHFWNSEDGSAIDTWDLAKDARRSKLGPAYGRFIADKNLVTIGKHTVCWDLSAPEAPKALYAIRTSGSYGDPRFAFSPNNKILAVENGNHEIYFLDPMSGKCHGILAAPFKDILPKNRSFSTSSSRISINGSSVDSSVSFKRVEMLRSRIGAFAFSPNGNLFAGMTRNGEIFVWDLVENKLVGNFFTVTNNPNRLNWANNDHLLVGNKLINVNLGAAVWEIVLDDDVRSIEHTSDGQAWGLSRFAINPIQLVPDSLSEKLEELQLNKEDLLAISPDSKIAIKWTLPNFHRTDPIEQNKPDSRPQQKLETNITRNGQSLDGGAEIVVTSTMDREKANRLRISDIISSKERGFVDEKRKQASIQCKLNDEILWSKTRMFGLRGISIQTQGNENFQQAVDRVCTPTRSFYADFYIPQYFYRLPGGKLLGKTKITKAGVASGN